MMTTTPPRHNPPKTVYVMGHWRHPPYDYAAAAAARAAARAAAAAARAAARAATRAAAAAGPPPLMFPAPPPPSPLPPPPPPRVFTVKFSPRRRRRRLGLHLVRVTTPDQDFMIELPFDRALPKRKYLVVDLTTDN